LGNTLKKYSKTRVLLGGLALTTLLFTGCGDSENFVFTNTVQNNPVLTPPQAVNDARSALGNATVTYTAANGVLNNDTPNGASISAFDATASSGGTVTLNADGSFSYTPAAQFVGSETFTYTLANNDGESTATVTMTSTGNGWFVDNTAGTTGDGTQAAPFDTLAEAVAVAQSGDTIYVRRGNGTATGLSTPITLPQGVSLIGEGEGLILAQTVEAQGQAPLLGETVTLSGNNVVSGFTFTGANTAVIADGVTNCTISNNRFEGGSATDLQVYLESTTGTIAVTDNTFIQDFDADSVTILADTTCTFNVSNNTFQMAGATANGDDCVTIQVQNGGNATFEISGNLFDGSDSTNPSMERGIHLALSGNNSQASLTANGNRSTLLSARDVELVATESTQLNTVFTNNIFEDCDQLSVGLLARDSAEVVAVFEANTISGGQEAILADADDTSDLRLALRNNANLAGVLRAVRIQAGVAGWMCAEIVGNTFGGDLRFNESTTDSLDVEQFGNSMGDLLATLNTFTTGGIDVQTGTVTPVSDNGCSIP
jgi:hypothetical protein